MLEKDTEFCFLHTAFEKLVRLFTGGEGEREGERVHANRNKA